MSDTFTCWYCKEDKDISYLKKGSASKCGKKGKCTPCHQEYCRNYMANKSAELRPETSMDCDNCDRTFSQFKPGGKEKKTCCPFCKSENIRGYLEG